MEFNSHKNIAIRSLISPDFRRQSGMQPDLNSRTMNGKMEMTIQSTTFNEVQGFPRFFIYPSKRKYPFHFGKLHRSLRLPICLFVCYVWSPAGCGIVASRIQLPDGTTDAFPIRLPNSGLQCYRDEPANHKVHQIAITYLFILTKKTVLCTIFWCVIYAKHVMKSS